MGSGTQIVDAIKEHGLDNFEKLILYVFYNQKDALKKEKELVNREFIARNDTYNLCIGGSF